MEYGDTAVRTFDRAGVFSFFCSPHVIDGMQGIVVVLPKGSPLPDPLPPPPAISSSPAPSQPVPAGPPDTIVTVAGGAGNGGPPTAASLYLPEGVVLDDRGSLYIADTRNCQI